MIKTKKNKRIQTIKMTLMEIKMAKMMMVKIKMIRTEAQKIKIKIKVMITTEIIMEQVTMETEEVILMEATATVTMVMEEATQMEVTETGAVEVAMVAVA